MLTEGKAKIKVELKNIVSKRMDVFYNPVMKLNRDISIEILRLQPKAMRIALPLAGSGIRGIRFLLEVPETVKEIAFNDYNKKAMRSIVENLKLNKIRDFRKIPLFNKEAQIFLMQSNGYDYIDIDPFGTPNPFLDAACQRIAREGILAVTATDTAPLCGTYPKVCKRHYDATPLRNELKHIIGLRILIRKVQLVGSQYEKAMIPVFSYFKDHYFRVFFHCVKSKSKCDKLLASHKFLLFCENCFDYCFSDFNSGKCNCGNDMVYAGKLYSGSLWHKKYRKISLIKEIPKESLFDGKYYQIHKLYSKLKKPIPNFKSIMDKITKNKFIASRTHFSGKMIKTNIPDIRKLLN